jgi:hypothetical protein
MPEPHSKAITHGDSSEHSCYFFTHADFADNADFTRPGGFEIRRKKGSTYENGGFVIPL